MAQPLGFGLNGKSIYMNVAMPKVVECSFSVLSTAGAGIQSLKSNGYISNIFMNSSAAAGGNPNPAAGFMQIQLNNNSNVFLGLQASVVSGSQTSTKIDNAALVAGNVYVISVLGNASLAKWQAIGLPVGVTPAVGATFVALNNGGAGNVLTSRVQVIAPSGIQCVEVFGNPDTMNNSSIAANGGQIIHAAFLAPTVTAGAYGTPMIPTAPQDGSIVKLALWFDGSSVTVDGE